MGPGAMGPRAAIREKLHVDAFVGVVHVCVAEGNILDSGGRDGAWRKFMGVVRRNSEKTIDLIYR